jgi:hypothetical protein
VGGCSATGSPVYLRPFWLRDEYSSRSSRPCQPLVLTFSFPFTGHFLSAFQPRNLQNIAAPARRGRDILPHSYPLSTNPHTHSSKNPFATLFPRPVNSPESLSQKRFQRRHTYRSGSWDIGGSLPVRRHQIAGLSVLPVTLNEKDHTWT